VCLQPHRSIAIQASTTGRPFPRRVKQSQLPPSRCANQPAFSSSLCEAEPKAKGLQTANWGRRICHLFKTMSWFDHSSNDKYFLVCKSTVGYLPRECLSSTRTKALHGSKLFRARDLFNCIDVFNTCPLHISVTQSRGWGGGGDGLRGSCREFSIRASFDVDPV
jgi:hypothetical protein